MENLLLKTLSPQAAKTYSLLLKNDRLSAKEIGRRLGIVENSVYRELKELSRLGLITTTNGYPKKFTAKPAPEAMGFLTMLFRQNFYEFFGRQNKVETDELRISFFQTRDELLKLSVKDMKKSKHYVNFIISGHEVSADIMLAQKQAVDSGVKMRKLIQGLTPENIRMAKSWQKMGIEVRHTPNINARIVTYDGMITHFGSYDQKNHLESVGVRFAYQPFAKLMDEMFEQKWQQAKII